ncbi:MAG TPA: hypothetical protein VJ259_03950, partial [Actinomycetota bacterium]|nr:hypothetical protein [Actinomycetota bacterium]
MPTLSNLPALSGPAGTGSRLVSLARLATESGGRFTERTNDPTLGVARAQRDLGCVYSVGFHDDDPKEDRAKSVTIRVRREGLRVLSPSAYVFRSASAKRESLIRAAYLSPEMFQTGVVRAHVFPIRPVSKERWDALLAVSFGVSLAGVTGPTEREFGAVLQSGSLVVHRFNRKIRLEPDKDATSEPLVTFLERVTLRPGKYTVTSVVTDPATAKPHSI